MAKKLNGEIISADSRQVYRKLDIGTSKEGVTKELRIRNKELGIKSENLALKQIKQNARYIDKIPQYMIDVAGPGDKFTLFDWLDGAKLAIEDIFSRGKTPIVVGGTGLYVQSLVEGFEHQNQKPETRNQNKKIKIKKFSRQELDKKQLEELQNIYSKFEIRNSKLDLNNPRRLIRAIELAQEGINPTKNKPDFEVLQIGITLDRKDLYKKIDGLVDEWFERGFSEEVRNLLEEGVLPEWLNQIGLEYRIMSQYLLQENQNDEELNKMKQEMKFAIHHYARRQLTWFRRFEEIAWVENKEQALNLAKQFLKSTIN